MNIRARDHFAFGINALFYEYVDIFLLEKLGNRVRGRLIVEKSSALRFGFPVGSVTVVIENNTGMVFQKFCRIFFTVFFKFLRSRKSVHRFRKFLRRNGVEYDIGIGNGSLRTEHTELEFIARKRKRRSTVPVRHIDGENGRFGNTDRTGNRFLGNIFPAEYDTVYDRAQLIAEIRRDNGGRRFVRTQTVIVPRRRDACAQNALIIVHRRKHAGKNEHEQRIFFGLFTGIQQVQTGIGGKRPVVMFTASVHALERLFMQQTDESVFFRNLFHQFHGKLVVVYGYVSRGKNGGKFVLRGRHFVMLRLGVDPETPKRFVQIAHEFGDSAFERAKVMVFEFLSAGRKRAEQRSSRQLQIFPLQVNFFVDQEIFLFGPHRSGYFSALDPEQFQKPFRLRIERSHRL